MIHHYVIKFVIDFRQVDGTPISSINETDRHDITEVLLKVALNTITLTPNPVEVPMCTMLCLMLSIEVLMAINGDYDLTAMQPLSKCNFAISCRCILFMFI